MSLHARFHLASASLLVVALAFGCASTSSESEDAHEEPATEMPAQVGRDRAEVETNVSAVSSAVRSVSVYFETDSATLLPEGDLELERYAKSIIDHPEWGVVKITGHCDERGSDAYNLQLGKRRAESVKGKLLALAVPGSRLVTQSHGSRQPAVPGHNEEAWRLNRRSEIGNEAKLASARP